MKLIKIFAAVVTLGFSHNAQCGLWNSLKDVGKAVGNVAAEVADTAIVTVTNAPAASVNKADNANSAEQSISARESVLRIAPQAGSSNHFVNKEVVDRKTPVGGNRRPNGVFSVNTKSSGNTVSPNVRRQFGNDRADAETSRKFGSFLSEFSDLLEHIKVLSKKAFVQTKHYYIEPYDVYDTVRVDSSVISYNVKDMELKSKMMRWSACPKHESDFITWTNKMISAMNADIKTLKESVKQVEAVTANFCAFLNEYGRLNEKISALSAKIEGERKNYYLKPQDKYETIRLDSSCVMASNIQDMQLKNYLMRECLCPKKMSDFVVWTNEIVSAISRDISITEAEIVRREKYLKFLSEWEGLQNEYTKLLKRFKIDNVDLISVGFEGTTKEVKCGRMLNKEGRISEEFRQKLKALWNLQDETAFMCPESDEELQKWMAGTRNEYKVKSEKYRKEVAHVDSLLAELLNAITGDSTQGGSVDKDMAVMFFVDPDKAARLSARLKDVAAGCDNLPKEPDAYLGDLKAIASLEKGVGGIISEKKAAAKDVELLREKSKKASEYVKSLRSSDSSTPFVGEIKLGSTLVSVAENLYDIPFDVIKGKIMEYKFVFVTGQKDVLLGFGGDSDPAGMYLCKYSGVYLDGPEYGQAIKEYEKTLGNGASTETVDKVVGYDFDSIDGKKTWESWKLNYYANRERKLNECGRTEVAKTVGSLKCRVADKNKVRKFIVATTTIKGNGYEIVIDSDIGKHKAERISIIDTLALSKIK